MGASMEVAKYTERLVPSTRFVAVDGLVPQMAPGVVFVAPSASIIGDVTIGNGSRYVLMNVHNTPALDLLK
jgi:carbonic anhydrase/acetyltransferase-like protein (isoleucine patch superfamily)